MNEEVSYQTAYKVALKLTHEAVDDKGRAMYSGVYGWRLFFLSAAVL